MRELLSFASQYIAELSAVLPDTSSSIEPIRLMQQFRTLVKSDSNTINNDVDLIDGFLNIHSACEEYATTPAQVQDRNLLNVLKIQLACSKFLIDAKRNTYFLNRHPWKIIIGFSLLCMITGILLTATGIGSPFVLFVGLFGTSLTMTLPALLSVTSLFCFGVGFVTSGIVVGLGQLINYFVSKSLPPYHYKPNPITPKKPVSDPSSNEKQTNEKRTFAPYTAYTALHDAFFPFLSPAFTQFDHQTLEQGLTFRLENTYGYGAVEYYLIEALNNAKKIMNKDDRFEELCRICGVAVARVADLAWNEWKNYYQNHYEQEEAEAQKDEPSIKPVSGEVARFIILEGKNPYKILGVSPHATYAEIKKAFRNKALECHPDKIGEKGIELFKELNTAYGLLSTDNQKEEVDTYIAQTNRDSRATAMNYQ